MKNTEISEMCFRKLSLPRVRGGEGDEVSDGRREMKDWRKKRKGGQTERQTKRE